MKMSQQKTDISLRNFYIFNSQFGTKEGEEEKKILFYHPKSDDLDTQIKDIGLCEAIFQFSNTFTNDNSCKMMKTHKTIQFYYQPELNYWMIMTVNVPSEKKTKDGVEYTEYRSDDVHERIYRTLLEQSYHMYRLFLGTFESAVQQSDQRPIELIEKLEQFYSDHVSTLKFQNCDILDVLKSIQYLPLNQFQFLRIHNFIQMIESRFPIVRKCLFLFNGQLVWCEINPTDLYSIYAYLTSVACSKYQRSRLTDENLSVRKVHLSNETKTYQMIDCRAQNAMICIFIEDSASIEDIHNELREFIVPQLTLISSDIRDYLNSGDGSVTLLQASAASEPKFIFFNELNGRHIGTVHLHGKTSKISQIPSDIMNLVTDLYDSTNEKSAVQETVLKTRNNYWLVKKVSNSRHFYVIINKSSTLLEITDEAKRLFDEHAKKVHFDI